MFYSFSNAVLKAHGCTQDQNAVNHDLFKKKKKVIFLIVLYIQYIRCLVPPPFIPFKLGCISFTVKKIAYFTFHGLKTPGVISQYITI